MESIGECPAPALELRQKQQLLEADLAHVRAILGSMTEDSTYHFATDLGMHMNTQKLSESELADRCHISRTAVAKWASGIALPKGKERMKELGMALGMDEGALSDFLLANKYTRLYSKNPLDAVCKRVLHDYAGTANIVHLYRAELKKYELDSIPLPQNRVSVATSFLSLSLEAIDSDEGFDRWLTQNAGYFDATDKELLPSRNLTRFILLHVGYESIHEMYRFDSLPDSVRRLLYPIRSGKSYALRGLREKLIVFGLYSNMTDGDIDTMLGFARLAPLMAHTSSDKEASLKDRAETAIVASMRCAHERCSYYEYALVQRVLQNIVHVMAVGTIKNEMNLSIYDDLKLGYLERFRLLRDPYTMPIGEDEELFEDLYADHLSDYMRDMLYLLTYSGDLEDEETAPYIKHLSNSTSNEENFS